jgi:hypothetical protein
VRETILWRGIDRPGHEYCIVYRGREGWFVQGSAVFVHEQQPCCLDYVVACDPFWHSQTARVSGWIGNESLEINLEVDSEQGWLLNSVEQPVVHGCTDVDLNFSPSTNLLPIRRLNLAVGEEALVSAAWLRFPSLKLERLDQVYRRLGEHTYRYTSNDGEFTADLTVNSFGLVTSYPELWEEEAGHG